MLQTFLGRKQPSPESPPGATAAITGGIRPVDLYCYLVARFGEPNGFQNVLRKQDSDNWIHWHFSLRYQDEYIEVMAMTYRIELWVPHSVAAITADIAGEFVKAVKVDFASYGSAMGKIRAGLEEWQEFLNPHARLSQVLNQMCDRANELVATLPARLPHPHTSEESEAFGENFDRWLKVHAEVNGLCQSIRLLAPVAAESFVNLLIFVLLKPELRAQAGFHDGFVRRHINERVAELNIHCQHFTMPVDWSAPECRALHTLMNRRNDYLHGNFNPDREAYGTVYFKGTVPIFADWRDFYDRAFGPYLRSFSAQSATEDLTIVEGFKSYVMSCVDPKAYSNLRRLTETIELGYRPEKHRIGLLFPGVLHDAFATTEPPSFVHGGDGI
ncbi:MAG TPA: hypothetical protein VIM71_12535 [Lacunisphaera sp.]